MIVLKLALLNHASAYAAAYAQPAFRLGPEVDDAAISAVRSYNRVAVDRMAVPQRIPDAGLVDFLSQAQLYVGLFATVPASPACTATATR
jgi:hypothetical protein